MITITLHSHPEKGQDTHFRIVDCQPGTDPKDAKWERTQESHFLFGALFMSQSLRESEVTTMEMVRECMDEDNYEWPMLLRALGWPESDISTMWADHSVRENVERVRREARQNETSRDDFEKYLRGGSHVR